MNWKHRSGRRLDRSSPFPRMMMLAAFFFLGVVLGQVLAGKVSPSAGAELRNYLGEYLQFEQQLQVGPETVLSALRLYFRYPLLAFLFGFVSAGAVLLPCVSVAFGFFLSFSVSCFTASFGTAGVLLALAALGARTVVTLPCFILLAVPAWETSCEMLTLGRGAGYGKKSWIRLLVCSAVLLGGVCFELVFGPWLLRAALEHMLG